MSIKHSFQSNVSDAGVPPGEVKPSDWNDSHVLDGLLAVLDGIGVQPNSIPFVDGGGHGAIINFSTFFQTICGTANATALLAAIGAAALASPAFTGTPTAPTATTADNTTKIATTAFVKNAITALIAGSPALLDTLNELAAAIGNDPNFATTMANSLALKAPLNSPTLTGTAAAPTPATTDNSTKIATTAFVKNVMTTGIGLASNQNLNLVTTPGNYFTIDSASTNSPVADWLMIDVRDMQPSFPGDVMQRAVALFTADAYVRTQVGGSWGAWRKVIELDAAGKLPAADASQLTNVLLPKSSAVLGADVAMPAANTWYDGPSFTLGTGVFLVIASVAVKDTTANSPFIARITDGTTVFGNTGFFYNFLASGRGYATCQAFVTNPAAAVKVQALNSATATGTILKNDTAQGADTKIIAIKIG